VQALLRQSYLDTDEARTSAIRWRTKDWQPGTNSRDTNLPQATFEPTTVQRRTKKNKHKNRSSIDRRRTGLALPGQPTGGADLSQTRLSSLLLPRADGVQALLRQGFWAQRSRKPLGYPKTDEALALLWLGATGMHTDLPQTWLLAHYGSRQKCAGLAPAKLLGSEVAEKTSAMVCACVCEVHIHTHGPLLHTAEECRPCSGKATWTLRKRNPQQSDGEQRTGNRAKTVGTQTYHKQISSQLQYKEIRQIKKKNIYKHMLNKTNANRTGTTGATDRWGRPITSKALEPTIAKGRWCAGLVPARLLGAKVKENPRLPENGRGAGPAAAGGDRHAHRPTTILAFGPLLLSAENVQALFRQSFWALRWPKKPQQWCVPV
jgi:hypothetical protein